MRLLSLFSGCGGMDIGFEGGFTCLKKSVNQSLHPDWVTEDRGQWTTLKRTNFETVFANDIRPGAQAAWEGYFQRGGIYHLESIVDIVKEEKNGKKILPRDIDIVTGGFPCQDFSVAGKRQGFKSQKNHDGKLLTTDEPTIENRGRLYMWMRDVISITEPKMFIAENVKGLTNLDDVQEVIQNDFAAAGNGGYLVVPAQILYAPDYGVPQSRERVIFIGFRKNALRSEALEALQQKKIDEKYNPYPPKTHGEGLEPIVTCRDALGDLEEPDIAIDPAQQKFSRAKFMGRHCQGQKEIDLNSVSPAIRSEHHGNIEFRRLNRLHGGQHTEELNAGLEERRLTVRECARLQTFPDNYNFIIPRRVSASEAYKIIGNAVPCMMAYNIAQNIQEKWELYFRRG